MSDLKRTRILKTRETSSLQNQQRRRLRSPTFETIVQDNPNLSPDKPKKRTSSVQRAPRQDYLSRTRTSSATTNRKKSVQDSDFMDLRRQRRGLSETDSFTHNRDNIDKLRATFFKEQRPRKTASRRDELSEQILPRKSPIEVVIDPTMQRPRIVSKRPAPTKTEEIPDELPRRPSQSTMHGQVIQKVVYEKKPKKIAEPAKPAPQEEPVPKAAQPRRSLASSQVYSVEKTATKEPTVGMDRAKLRRERLALLKEKLPSDDEPCAASMTVRTKMPDERPRVSFNLTNVPPPTKSVSRIDESILELKKMINQSHIEAREEKPFTEPTDFSRACRFPSEYLASQIGLEEEEDEDENEEQLTPKKAPPMPEPEPEPEEAPVSRKLKLAEVLEMRRSGRRKNEVIEFTQDDFVPPKRDKKKETKISSPIRMSNISGVVSTDEFLKLETEMLDSNGESEEYDKGVPNFSKLSSVIRKQMGNEAAPILNEMKPHRFEHFVLLVAQPIGRIDAVYLLTSNMQKIVKLCGNGPKQLTQSEIDSYWYFDVVSKQFEEAMKPGFRANLDAVSVY